MKSFNSHEHLTEASKVPVVLVLLVEDDEDDYILVSDLLAAADRVAFSVTWASSYADGLRSLDRGEFDVCLVDYRLGAHKGSELIRSVVSRNPEHPPMIMLTGQDGEQSDIEALDAGASDFLVKERIDTATLERTICYALERDRAMRAMAARENELRVITNELDNGLLLTDQAHKILFINPSGRTMLGQSEGEKIPVQLRFRHRHSRREAVFEREHHRLILDVHHSETEWHGQPVHILTLHDITARRQAEASLQAIEERYALAAEGANDGLWDWDMQQNHIYFSPRWLDMVGLSQDDAIESPEAWFDLVHPEDLDGLTKSIENHLNGLTAHLIYSYRLRHKDGGYRYMLCRGRYVADKDGIPYRMAGSQTDITRQKDAEQQLRHDMLHDSLTGLPNQTLFLDRLQALFNLYKRQTTLRFGLVYVDLDNFKLINDSLGHMQGDRLLVKVARRLKSCMRPSDSIARLGGDEFAMILTNTSEAIDAMRVAERITETLEKPFDLEGEEVFMSSSIGIALANEAYLRPEDMLRDADTAMYRAKHNGKNGYAIFSQDMHQAAIKRLKIETELRRAISDHQLEPYFQPIVDMRSEQVAGFETLVRWIHPQRGLITPGDFIPVSEETGLIIPLGEQVLDMACRYRGAWASALAHCPDIYISVNLSPRQLNHADLPARVLRVIEEHALDPANVRLEITETVLMQNADQALRILTQFRDMNLKIYLDDFGTGYSSLSYMHKFPIDVLKIDQSFVGRIDQEGDKARKIIEIILNLARTLGIDVVAEGIETDTQLAMLRDMGCPYGQGYYFAKPLKPNDAFSLLTGQVPWLQPT